MSNTDSPWDERTISSHPVPRFNDDGNKTDITLVHVHGVLCENCGPLTRKELGWGYTWPIWTSVAIVRMTHLHMSCDGGRLMFELGVLAIPGQKQECCNEPDGRFNIPATTEEAFAPPLQSLQDAYRQTRRVNEPPPELFLENFAPSSGSLEIVECIASKAGP